MVYVHGTVFLTFLFTKTNLDPKFFQKYFYIYIFLHDDDDNDNDDD